MGFGIGRADGTEHDGGPRTGQPATISLDG